jgi:eukaryotic-like serine/threonine-protein kinase
MGHVFMALTGQAGVERVCALKVLKEVRAGRDAEELTQRFLDEAKVVTKLSHENLVYVFDFGIHERQGYLAMEYVQGKSITETWNRCAARRDGFPIGMSVYYIAELVSALWYASNVDGLGLVHRDISPSNVMLTYTGGVKLIDFGLAKWKAKVVQTATGVQWGKTSYMSPEQYMGKPVDHRSDLYSAGVILWELLTGRQLFPPSESRLPNAAASPPSRFTHDVTPALDQVVTKALSIHAADRFQSGEEMCAALLAEMPKERGGKMQAAKFIGRLFEAEQRAELAEQRDLVERASKMENDAEAERGERSDPERSDPAPISVPIADGETSPDPDPDALIGKTLSDRYFIRRLVGEGAMGRVYEGHHTGIGKRVAIKIAHQVERRKSEVAKRFQREALAPAQIGHPNVADVTDCGTTPGGEFFFVMEFIDGVSLDTVIKRDGQLSVERSLTIAAQICRALEAAHRAGIIHRDLKPSNVMLVRSQDQEEMVKVLDFGVAKFLHETGDGVNLTLTDATVGTPKYMSPEQIRGGGKVDFRSDIYSLGAILYTMLTGGRLPVEGESVEEIWQHKLTRDPYPLHGYRSDLSRDFEELVMACLARDAAERPPSAGELKKKILTHLEAARATSGSIMAMKSPSQTEILSKRILRRRTRVGIALGTLTAALVAVTGMYFVHRPDSSPRGTPAPLEHPPAARENQAQTPATLPLAQASGPEPPAPAAAAIVPTAPATAFPTTRELTPPPDSPKQLRQAAETTGAPSTTTRVPSRISPPALASPVQPRSAGAASGFAAPKIAAHRVTGKPAPPTYDEDHAGEASDDTATAAVAKAEAAFSDRRMAAARILATEAVAAARKAAPTVKVRAFVIMGKVELASEEFAEAERTFERALAIDPQHPGARKGMELTRAAAAKAVHP